MAPTIMGNTVSQSRLTGRILIPRTSIIAGMPIRPVIRSGAG